MEALNIASPHARAEVRAEGGIVRHVEFRLQDRWIKPLADAPWAGDSRVAEGFMRWLGGTFFCLPFGGMALPADASPAWLAADDGTCDSSLHGAAATGTWAFTSVADCAATLSCNYPVAHSVVRVDQRITCDLERPLIRFELSIHMRRRARLAAAFHPIIRLPDRPRALHLEACFARGATYPGYALSDLNGDEGFERLDDAGGYDFALLPHGEACELQVQILNAEGPISARFLDEGFALEIDWDRSTLPHAMLWLHDRGLAGAPWNGQFRGLGIEPCLAAFDLSTGIATASNPIAAAGYPTCLDLDPERASQMWMTLAVWP